MTGRIRKDSKKMHATEENFNSKRTSFIKYLYYSVITLAIIFVLVYYVIPAIG